MIPTFLQDAFFKGIGQDEDCQENGKLYLGLIDVFQGRSKDDLNSRYPGEVLHEHHILPRSRLFWPEFENCKENLVIVPATIHFMILHKILLQCFPKGSRKRGFMVLAYVQNIDQLLKDSNFRFSEEDQKFYLSCKEEIRGEGNPMYGTKLMHRWDESKSRWIEERRLPEEFPTEENWSLGKAPKKEKETDNMCEITPLQQAVNDALENLIQSRIAEMQKSLDEQIEDIQDIDELRRLSILINLQMARLLDIPLERYPKKMRGRQSPFRTFFLDNLEEINKKLQENITESAVKDCVFSTQWKETADMVRTRIQKELAISTDSARRIYGWYVYYKRSDWEDPSMKESIMRRL